jgi:hypothetical protein
MTTWVPSIRRPWPCRSHAQPTRLGRRPRSRRPCINPAPTGEPASFEPPTQRALGGLAIGRHPARWGGSVKPVGGLIAATHAESRGVRCLDEGLCMLCLGGQRGGQRAMARSNETYEPVVAVSNAYPRSRVGS